MRPATRHTGKQPQKPSTDIPSSGHHIPPPDPTDKTSDYWIREGHLRKRIHMVPKNILRLSRVDIRWIRYWQFSSIKNDNHQTVGWKSTKTHRQWADNWTTTTTVTTVDRINKLWGETITQGTTWGGRRRQPTSHQGKSNISAKATSRTRDHGTQLDTHALQIMVSHLHTRDVADQMHIHNEAAADPSYTSILHF